MGLNTVLSQAEVEPPPDVTGKDVVMVDTSRHFSKLLVVKINAEFQVSGRMVSRKQLPKRSGRYVRIRWDDLALLQ